VKENLEENQNIVLEQSQLHMVSELLLQDAFHNQALDVGKCVEKVIKDGTHGNKQYVILKEMHTQFQTDMFLIAPVLTFMTSRTRPRLNHAELQKLPTQLAMSFLQKQNVGDFDEFYVQQFIAQLQNDYLEFKLNY